MAIEDGGAAFPFQELGMDGLPNSGVWGGMSLRDWFAAHAMSALIMRSTCERDWKSVGETAYEFADQMLAAQQDGAK